MSNEATGNAMSAGVTAPVIETDVRLIALYLPQFHPIRENDAWWGKGFTEWANVTKARPLFGGHYQPHLPGELGFYDLRVPETREAQAQLAADYGLHGFCYYHYWFNGRELLHRPLQEVVASGQPRFPFCICWANENWTRAWDGRDRQILIEQRYSSSDDRDHIRLLLPALKDARYIRVNGKLLLIIYRVESLPNPRATAELWREECARARLGDLFLCFMESFRAGIDPIDVGFDAAIEFAPDWRNPSGTYYSTWKGWLLKRLGVVSSAFDDHYVRAYDGLARKMASKPDPPYPFFRCVTPGFDNSARRAKLATIFHNSTPEVYGEWLQQMIYWTKRKHQPGRRIVFINAWNEWAEGNHLEPDAKFGRAYLEATREALSVAEPLGVTPESLG